MNSTEDLRSLYNLTSKHSNYQTLPACLEPFLDAKDIEVKSRYEKERLAFMLKHINPDGKVMLDIGGNSGFFTFEMLDRGAAHVDYFEGNGAHSEFVKKAGSLLHMEQKLEVYNEYFQFSDNAADHRSYDVVLLLNVLHHVGDDYGDKNLSIEKSKEKILESLAFIASKTTRLIFQLGFCWQGNRNLLLFENGTKQEMLDFITAGVKGKWMIEEIGVAEMEDGIVSYRHPTSNNMLRQDKLGEFLNRPIFIMKSLQL